MYAVPHGPRPKGHHGKDGSGAVFSWILPQQTREAVASGCEASVTLCVPEETRTCVCEQRCCLDTQKTAGHRVDEGRGMRRQALPWVISVQESGTLGGPNIPGILFDLSFQ